MPQPFRVHTGVVAPLDRANVDTDQIVPKQFLKRVERSGFGQFLFYDWARDADGHANPDFVLNQPAYRGASILVTGRNFGCGSSREHAPWALGDFGFRAIVAPSFADIFQTNCIKNGILPVVLGEADVARLVQQAQSKPGCAATIDLERCIVTGPDGAAVQFTLDEFSRSCLLGGLDEIGLTLRHTGAIEAYEQKNRQQPQFNRVTYRLGSPEQEKKPI